MQFRKIAVILAGALAVMLLPGCIGMAVRGIKEAVDPAQPMLRDSATFYASGVQATAVLLPVKKERSRAAAVFLGGEEANNQPLPGSEPPSPDVRMVLWTVLTNRAGATAEIEVESETCALGTAASKMVVLAPGQKVTLEPIWSARKQNLENLEVTLTLKLHGAVEKERLELAQVRKP